MLSLFIQEKITVALGFTLLHSLWEGVGLAFLTGMIMAFTRRSGAAVRYNLLMSALVLFVVGVFFTFLYEMEQHTTSQADWVGSRIGGWIGEHAGMIAAVWFGVMCMKLIKLSFDLYALQRLKVVRVKPLAEHLQVRAKHLADGLGIRKIIRIVESGIVRVPLVIGYIRPVILIPAGMIARVTPEDLEVILLHELAHIRRMDYLVNIFLRIVSILLFFNPAVLWVSSLIRTERENCCDDLVIRHTGDKVDYIRALLHFEEQRAPSYAMAFGGSSRMLSRVERLAAGYSRTLNRMELLILTLLLVLTCYFMGHPVFSMRASMPAPAGTSARTATSMQAATSARTGTSSRASPGAQTAPADGSQAAAMETKLKAEAVAGRGRPPDAHP